MAPIHSKIAGTTFVENSKDKISLLTKGQVLLLIPEPENEFDSNAIEIYTEDFVKLGYIKKDLAQSLSESIKKGNKYIANVLEVTGGSEDKENFGCNIIIKKFNILDDVMELPNRLFGLENKELALKLRTEELKKQITQIENKTYFEVSQELDGEKKKYSNEEMRKIETASRLDNNMEFYSMKKDYEFKLYELSKLQNEIRYCDRLWKTERALILSRGGNNE